jgi:hypothetical protein
VKDKKEKDEAELKANQEREKREQEEVNMGKIFDKCRSSSQHLNSGR